MGEFKVGDLLFGKNDSYGVTDTRMTKCKVIQLLDEYDDDYDDDEEMKIEILEHDCEQYVGRIYTVDNISEDFGYHEDQGVEEITEESIEETIEEAVEEIVEDEIIEDEMKKFKVGDFIVGKEGNDYGITCEDMFKGEVTLLGTDGTEMEVEILEHKDKSCVGSTYYVENSLEQFSYYLSPSPSMEREAVNVDILEKEIAEQVEQVEDTITEDKILGGHKMIEININKRMQEAMPEKEVHELKGRYILITSPSKATNTQELCRLVTGKGGEAHLVTVENGNRYHDVSFEPQADVGVFIEYLREKFTDFRILREDEVKVKIEVNIQL